MSRGDKHRALLDGARRIFARDGYTRASIDVIAAEAEVSTRTIYNHFGAKAALWEAVIVDSATRVADDQVAIIEGWIAELDDTAATTADLERDLVRLALRLGRTPARHPDHFALVRQVGADAEHLPAEALAAWRRAGPERVHAARTAAIVRLGEVGLLRVEDPDAAAHHLTQLADRPIAERSRFGAVPISDEEIKTVVASGVRTFLYGYVPRGVQQRSSGTS